MSLYTALYWYAVHIYTTYDKVEQRLRFSRVNNKKAPPSERKNMSVAKAVLGLLVRGWQRVTPGGRGRGIY
jgi:hypothetical protein